MKKKKSSENSRKKQVLAHLFEHCRQSGEHTFDNNLVRKIGEVYGFKNPFDATKTDNSSILPENMKEQGYCVVHLGKGNHKFVKAAELFFHKFEDIESPEIQWRYRRSLLNDMDGSESNMLAVGFNQRIVHDFLYNDIVASPKMYGSRRTKMDATYQLGEELIVATKLQMEMDLVTEYQGVVTIFEAKNKFPEDFAVYQLYHPFLYFHRLKDIKIDKINCCYLLRSRQGGNSVLRLYLYTFPDAGNPASIYLEKCEQYRLVER